MSPYAILRSVLFILPIVAIVDDVFLRILLTVLCVIVITQVIKPLLDHCARATARHILDQSTALLSSHPENASQHPESSATQNQALLKE
jgi:hypothetical protein